MKAPFELMVHRTPYYKVFIQAAFSSLGIPTSRLRFAVGSSAKGTISTTAA
jgi:tyrosyl-tRNA synthetase